MLSKLMVLRYSASTDIGNSSAHNLAVGYHAADETK